MSTIDRITADCVDDNRYVRDVEPMRIVERMNFDAWINGICQNNAGLLTTGKTYAEIALWKIPCICRQERFHRKNCINVLYKAFISGKAFSAMVILNEGHNARKDDDYFVPG